MFHAGGEVLEQLPGGGGQGAGRAGTQDPQEIARKHCPACICNFFCMLNEMSPFVSFLVGYVENYFQKFSFKS